jgi:hypothetical protein
MANNLLKNLTVATVIVFTVGAGSVWAQDMRSNLPTCEGKNYNYWDNCFGTYSLKMGTNI